MAGFPQGGALGWSWVIWGAMLPARGCNWRPQGHPRVGPSEASPRVPRRLGDESAPTLRAAETRRRRDCISLMGGLV